jgi:hypothetical protein
MGQTTTTSVLNAEIEKVRPKVPVLYDYDAGFYSTIAKKPVEKISGRDMRIPLALDPGGYFGYSDFDGGDLGTGGGLAWEKAVINTKSFKYALQWTWKSELETDDTRKAVVNAFRELMSKAMPEFQRQSDNQCLTSGNGVIGTVTTPTGGGVTSITFTTDGFGVRLMRKGQRVNVYDSTLATQRTASGPVEITYLDIPTKTIKLASAVAGITAGDVIVPEGLNGANPVGLFGVYYHNNSASTGTWLGMDRATYPQVRANSVDAGAGALALPYARLAINKIGDRLGIDRKTKLTAWMHPCQSQAYEQLGQLVTVINKQAKEEQLDMYFDVQRIAGAPIKQHYSWDKTRIDFITNDTWGRAELKAPGFFTNGGRKVFEMRGPSGGVATSSVFYLVAAWNLFTDNPAGQTAITNLEVPEGY